MAAGDINLENAISGLKDLAKIIHDAPRWMCTHPKTAGVSASVFEMLRIAFLSLGEESNPGTENLSSILPVGFGSYLCTKIINEYALRNRETVEPPENAGLVNRVEHFVFNNPAFFSLLPGLAAFWLFTYGFEGLTKDAPARRYIYIPLLYPFAHFTLDVRRANELFSRAYTSLKSKNIVQRAFDFILEKPMISAGLVGISLFYYQLNNYFEWGMQNQPFSSTMLASLLSFIPACGAYGVHTFGSGLLHSSSINLFRKNLNIFLNDAKGKYDNALSELERLVEMPTSPEQRSRIFLKMADIYSKKDEMDRALLNVKFALEASEEKKISMNPFDWLRDLFFVDAIIDRVKNTLDEFKNNPVAKTRQSVFYFRRKNFDAALAKIDKAINLCPGDSSFKIIKAVELDAIHRYDDAKSVWLDVVKNAIFNKAKEFTTISDSSKEVLTVSSDALLSDVFVFSRSDLIDDLLNEYNRSRFVFDCYSDRRKVPNPFAFLNLPELGFSEEEIRNSFFRRAYFINSRMKGYVLDKFDLTAGDIPDILSLYFDFVQRVTAQKDRLNKYSANVPALDYSRIFANKFVSRMPCDGKNKTILFENFFPVISYLNGRNRSLIHGNFHSRNIIKGDSYGIIDFGDMCFALDTIGIEQVFANLSLDEDVKLGIYNISADFDDAGRLKDEFICDCIFSSVFVASHFLGRSYYYREGDASLYKKNLLTSLDMLIKNSFVDREEKKRVEQFKQAVELLHFN